MPTRDLRRRPVQGCRKSMRRLKQLLLTTSGAVVFMVMAGNAFGDAYAPPTAGVESPQASRDAAQRIDFEVSIVKETKDSAQGCDADFDYGRFSSKGCTLLSVIEHQAYSLPADRIFGGPEWIASRRFDIEAKTDAMTAQHLATLSTSDQQHENQELFQHLLLLRFKLSTHWETRLLPAYALVVAKQGIKLKATKESAEHSSTSANRTSFIGRGLTLSQLADALTRELGGQLGRQVVDQTGVHGRYDCQLSFRSAVSGDSALDNQEPSLFTAVQEQLGLTLKPVKSPVRVLVIDHAELPTGN